MKLPTPREIGEHCHECQCKDCECRRLGAFAAYAAVEKALREENDRLQGGNLADRAIGHHVEWIADALRKAMEEGE